MGPIRQWSLLTKPACLAQLPLQQKEMRGSGKEFHVAPEEVTRKPGVSHQLVSPSLGSGTVTPASWLAQWVGFALDLGEGGWDL